MPPASGNYSSISENANTQHRPTPWYWRLIALAASWMILGGYLLLPGLYAKDAQLKISQAVLSVFVVALLTAGYSFTALLCFACRDERFQADGVFLPALTSSILGILSIAYNFLLTRANNWGTAAITGTVISVTSTLVYTGLFVWIRRRIGKSKQKSQPPPNLWSDQSYYSNFLQNMYPTAARAPPPEAALSEDERVNQQMALLLVKSDPRPSPDANSTTFRIDLPEDRELQERQAHSQELVGSPGVPGEWNRARAESMPDSLGEEQAWQQWQNRGRSPNRPRSSTSAQSAQSAQNAQNNHARNLSREERRREIELGHR